MVRLNSGLYNLTIQDHCSKPFSFLVWSVLLFSSVFTCYMLQNKIQQEQKFHFKSVCLFKPFTYPPCTFHISIATLYFSRHAFLWLLSPSLLRVVKDRHHSHLNPWWPLPCSCLMWPCMPSIDLKSTRFSGQPYGQA